MRNPQHGGFRQYYNGFVFISFGKQKIVITYIDSEAPSVAEFF